MLVHAVIFASAVLPTIMDFSFNVLSNWDVMAEGSLSLHRNLNKADILLLLLSLLPNTGLDSHSRVLVAK